jgi:hypothetical protein
VKERQEPGYSTQTHKRYDAKAGRKVAKGDTKWRKAEAL